jgi:hypothetical protein
MNENPIRVALFKLLSEDAKLKELATGGVHPKQAPNGATPPYIIFGNSGEGVVRTFGNGPSLDKEVWYVKGVGEVAVAEAIDARCQELLDGQELDIEGHHCHDVYRIGLIDYSENKDGERFDHVGHEYKIDTEKKGV